MARRWVVALCLVAGTVVTVGCAQLFPPEPVAGSGFRLDPLITGLDKPLGVVDPPGDRALVLEQTGRVRVWDGTSLGGEPFLDLRGQVSTGFEQGLLGLALSPHRDEVVVSYTNPAGDSRLVRYDVARDPYRADPATREVLLRVDQPYGNHNGGHVLFGPDGYLWYGLGDGGSARDPEDNGQDPTTLLGSLLRLDVDTDQGYAVPETNPFVGSEGRDEIWAYGLRNPWRFSFDRATDDLWIGDVGQDTREEVDREPSDHPGGANYGWRVWEGTHRLHGDQQPRSEVRFPVTEYPTGEMGCSVTGGHVYRGSAIPGLEGTYLFGDFCSGTIWGLAPEGDGWNRTVRAETDLKITSFGETDAGEVRVLDRRGTVYAVRPDR